MTFPQAVAEVAGLAGISMPDAAPLTAEQKAEYGRKMREREEQKKIREQQAAADRSARAMSAGMIWKQCDALHGSLGWTYFEWRCPGLAPAQSESEIRFHPKLEIDPDNPRGDTWPAIVARVVDVNGKGIAVWRIYLKPNGEPLRDREGRKVKMGYGPAAGGACRLGGLANEIGLCEGIETGRAIKLLGVSYPVWPALMTSGIIGFVIPPGIKRITCYPDPDGTKLKTKHKADGTPFISQPPGRACVANFKERNPGFDIREADAAFKDDYLEIAQKMKGVPQR